jgi:amino acid transporter
MTQKILGTRDVFIMSVAANLGPRWIAIAAALGAASLMFWFLGALLFLLPFALIVVEFATRYPEEGGIYVWVDKHLGGLSSFIVAWCYWVNNFFFYPAILTFFATSLVYAFGRPDLAKNEVFIAWTIIIAFWAIIGLTLFGVKMSKIVGALGGVGSSLIFFLLIILGFTTFFLFHQSATPFDLQSFIPHSSILSNLSSLSIMMFAMAGVEIIPTLANCIRNPEKVLPRALIYFAFFIFLAYVFATFAMNLVLSPSAVKETTGLVRAFELIGIKLHITGLARFIAAFIALSEISALMLWLLAPAIMFFKATPRGILPDFLHRENKRGVPANALLFQGVLVTIIILCTSLLPTVNLMYQALILMTTIVYFIPYFFVLIAYVKFKRAGGRGTYVVPGGKAGAMLMSALVFISLLFAVAMSFAPTSNLVGFKEIFMYELEIAGGPIVMILIALALYKFRCHPKAGSR